MNMWLIEHFQSNSVLLFHKKMTMCNCFSADGCIAKVQSYGDRNITCTGERRFDKPQKVFLAASNCRSTIGLLINYKLSVFGFANKDLCQEDKNHTLSLHSQLKLLTCFTLLLGVFILLHKSAWVIKMCSLISRKTEVSDNTRM